MRRSWQSRLRKTAEFTDLDEVLVEEYNDGFEFNMMTWVSDGKVNVISIADREKTHCRRQMLPISTRNVYPSRLLSNVYEPAKDLLTVLYCTYRTDGRTSFYAVFLEAG